MLTEASSEDGAAEEITDVVGEVSVQLDGSHGPVCNLSLIHISEPTRPY